MQALDIDLASLERRYKRAVHILQALGLLSAPLVPAPHLHSAVAQVGLGVLQRLRRDFQSLEAELAGSPINNAAVLQINLRIQAIQQHCEALSKWPKPPAVDSFASLERKLHQLARLTESVLADDSSALVRLRRRSAITSALELFCELRETVKNVLENNENRSRDRVRGLLHNIGNQQTVLVGMLKSLLVTGPKFSLVATDPYNDQNTPSSFSKNVRDATESANCAVCGDELNALCAACTKRCARAVQLVTIITSALQVAASDMHEIKKLIEGDTLTAYEERVAKEGAAVEKHHALKHKQRLLRELRRDTANLRATVKRREEDVAQAIKRVVDLRSHQFLRLEPLEEEAKEARFKLVAARAAFSTAQGECVRRLQTVFGFHTSPFDPKRVQLLRHSLPRNSAFLQEKHDALAAALGDLLRLVELLARILRTPLPHAMKFQGSSSYLSGEDGQVCRLRVNLLDLDGFQSALSLLSDNIRVLTRHNSLRIATDSPRPLKLDPLQALLALFEQFHLPNLAALTEDSPRGDDEGTDWHDFTILSRQPQTPLSASSSTGEPRVSRELLKKDTNVAKDEFDDWEDVGSLS